DFLLNTKVLLMATSGGSRGAISALETAGKLVSRFGGEVVTIFSLPLFGENFDSEIGISNAELKEKHQEALDLFLSKL
ncbi:NADPH-dependent FMN reductase, partial [Aquimarina celericrescens]|nr:NADPH-dependent FMN reductase [Aquimarina celericrescens]